jgi:hypothetical protein
MLCKIHFAGLGHFVIYSRCLHKLLVNSHAQCLGECEKKLEKGEKVKVYMHTRYRHVVSPDCTGPYVGITLGQTRESMGTVVRRFLTNAKNGNRCIGSPWPWCPCERYVVMCTLVASIP